MHRAFSIGLDAQITKLHGVALGALALGLLELSFFVDTLFGGLPLLDVLPMVLERLPFRPNDLEIVGAFARLEPDV
jgi:hypothetical protein